MSFVVSASGVIPAERRSCFARLRDFTSWRAFMPRSFRALRGPGRDLAVGDWLFLLIDAKPSPLPFFTPVTVLRVTLDREITWGGGIPGVLVGEHAFFFEDAADGATLVRSEETWSGALTGFEPAAKMIRAASARIGQEQIAALARSVAASRAA